MPSAAPATPAPTTSVAVTERLPGAVGDAGKVELEAEPLFVPVGPTHVHRLDAVQRLLRKSDDLRILGRDLRRHGAGRRPQFAWGHDVEHSAVAFQHKGGNSFACVHHRPHELLWYHATQMGGP